MSVLSVKALKPPLFLELSTKQQTDTIGKQLVNKLEHVEAIGVGGELNG